jgi:hypothetical protein
MNKPKRWSLYLVTAVFAAVIIMSALWIQNGLAETNQQQTTPGSDENIHTVMVTGNGRVSASPDAAVVQLGVQTEAETAEEALNENNQRVQSLLDAISATGVARDDIQTQSIRLFPRYEFHEDGTRTLTGYEASNLIRIRVRELESLGITLDEAVQAGSYTIENIQFEITDPTSLMEQARQLAMENARSKAEQLAALADSDLGAVIRIVESSGAPSPTVQREFSLAAEEASAVPVEPGTQEISVNVQVTWMLTVE